MFPKVAAKLSSQIPESSGKRQHEYNGIFDEIQDKN
jgi:hypothetical protein